MPVIDPKFISTWWYFLDGDGLVRLFENWREDQIQDIQARKLLQGDIGTHVMDVGGIYWETSITSPVVIAEVDGGGTQIANVFDILKVEFNKLRFPASYATSTYILESAEINITAEGVVVSMKFVSDTPQAFTPSFGPTEFDFYGRYAKWYDTLFYVTTDIANTYQIKEGKISIKADIKKNYFMSGSQTPWYSVQGYHVNGNLTAIVDPVNFSDFLITPQVAGNFQVVGQAITGIQIGTTSIGLGEAHMITNVSKTMNPDELINVSFSFESFARYSTVLG